MILVLKRHQLKELGVLDLLRIVVDSENDATLTDVLKKAPAIGSRSTIPTLVLQIME